jgi:hypothetical protein
MQLIMLTVVLQLAVEIDLAAAVIHRVIRGLVSLNYEYYSKLCKTQGRNP